MKRKITEKQMLKSLTDQLSEKGIMTDYNLSLIQDYVKLWKINQALYKDIETRGAKIDTVNSHGDAVVKTNESINDIQKNQVAMLKILQTLKLQDPVMKGSDDDYL